MSRWFVGSSSSSRSGSRDERPRQQHAPAPSAGQRVDDRIGRQVAAATGPARRAARAASRRAPRARAGGSEAIEAPPERRRSRPHRGGVVVGRDHVAQNRRGPRPTTSNTVRSSESGTSCSSRATRNAGLAPDGAGVGRQLASENAAAAWTCRCRCARSATRARPARSEATLRRAAADGRRRSRRGRARREASTKRSTERSATRPPGVAQVMLS